MQYNGSLKKVLKSSYLEKICLVFPFLLLLSNFSSAQNTKYFYRSWPNPKSWTPGSFTNTEVDTYNGDNFLRLSSTGSGSWQSAMISSDETFSLEGLKTNSEVNDSIQITVEVSDSSFSSVKDSVTKALSGGVEHFDISSISDATDFRIRAELSQSASDLNLTTLHHIQINGTVPETCEASDVEVTLTDPSGQESTYTSGFSVKSLPSDCGGGGNTTVWERTGSFCNIKGWYDANVSARTSFPAQYIWEYEFISNAYECLNLCTYRIRLEGPYGTWDEIVAELGCS